MNIIQKNGELYYSTDMSHTDSITFNSLDYSDLNIEWRRDNASTLSFKSPTSLNNGDRIRYQSTTGHNFGGQVYKVSKGLNNLYNYEVISYKRLYDTKIYNTFNNRTSNQILKYLLKNNPNSFRTDGLKSKSTLTHMQLVFHNKSLWEVIGSLAWLEYKAGHYINYYIDEIGRLVWEDIPMDKIGLSVNDVFSADYNDDMSDSITTASHVIDTTKGVVLANAKSTTDYLLRWGVIEEYNECDVQTNTTGSVNYTTTAAAGGKITPTDVNMRINKYTPKIPSKVISVVNNICSPKKAPKSNLKLCYNWVTSHVKYQYHYNTLTSVLGSINKGRANCCEFAAIMVAFGRAAGIKSQFVHGHNHVWSRHLVNGGWFTVDASTKRWGSHLHNSSYGGPPYSTMNTLSF